MSGFLRKAFSRKKPDTHPPQNLTATAETIAPPQQATDAHDVPADGDAHRVSSTTEVTLPSIFLPHSVLGDVNMTGQATITFHTDARPPVYVVTSLSTPPWEALEMAASIDEFGKQVYFRHFDNIPEGTYQYKIRLGDNQWMLDDTKEIGVDEMGNRNNLVHIERAIDEVSAASTSKSEASSTSSSSSSLHPAPQDASAYALNIQRELGLPYLLPTIYIPLRSSRNNNIQTEVTAPINVPSSIYRDWDSASSISTIEAMAMTEDVADDFPFPLEHEDWAPASYGYHVEPGSEEEPAAPLFRHESFGTDNASTSRSSGEVAKFGPGPQSPALETIQETNEEEPASPSDEQLTQPSNETESSAEINTNVLVASTPHPCEAGSPNKASDLGGFTVAPLVPHQTKSMPKAEAGRYNMAVNQTRMGDDSGPGLKDQGKVPDELDQAPLLRHETKAESTGYATGHQVHVTHQAGDSDDEISDELARSPLMHHETGTGPLSKTNNSNVIREHGSDPMFLHDTSSIYSDDLGELDRAPTLPHESGFSGENKNLESRESGSSANALPPYRTMSDQGSSDEEDVDELDRAPTIPHETVAGFSDEDNGLDELDFAPMLPHEPGYSSGSNIFTGSDDVSTPQIDTDPTEADTASERSRTRRIISGEEDPFAMKKSSSFTSENLRENVRGSIFGTTRRPMLSRDGSGEADFGLGGAPRLAHERSITLNSQSSSESIGTSRGGGWRPVSKDSVPFFSRHMNSRMFRSNSSLPHSLPRSDEEDLNLHDPGLEPFPIDRDQVFDRVVDIGNRLPEDIVPSPSGDMGSPAVFSQTCSSVDLAPIRSSSALSLHSITEDVDDETESQLPSPVLELARRVAHTELVEGDELATPMPQKKQFGYFGGKEDASAAEESEAQVVVPTARRRPAPVTGENHEEAEPTRRWGKAYAAMNLPPEPPAKHIPLPPPGPAIRIQEPEKAVKDGTESNGNQRVPTPYPGEDKAPNFFSKIYHAAGRAVRACALRMRSIFLVGVVVAAVAWWWQRV